MKRPFRVECLDHSTGQWKVWATYSHRATAEDVVRMWVGQFVLRVVEREEARS